MRTNGNLFPLNGCSTPFGIYEVGTRPRPMTVISTPSAQRLSASMRLAMLAPVSHPLHRLGAQRLSASMRLALGSCQGILVS